MHPVEIVFAKTLRLALEEADAHIRHVRRINDYVREKLVKLPDIVINSPGRKHCLLSSTFLMSEQSAAKSC